MTTEARRPSMTPLAAPWIIPPLLRKACAAVGARVGAAFEETQPRLRPIAGADVLRAGDALGYHEVARHFGSGERCELYLVIDTIRANERIARIPRRATLLRDPGFADELRVSAELLLNYASPHLATVIAHGMTDEGAPRPYRIIERLVGRNLGAYLRRRGRLEVALILEVGAQVADGLTNLHRIGLTGAELHPGAVMLNHIEGDHFSIKLTGLDRVRRIRDATDVGAELRSFGALLYQLIVGGPPATSGSEGPLSLTEAGCEVPPALEELVRQLSQGAGPTSASEVKDALRSIGQSMGRSPYGSMLGPRVPPKVRRGRPASKPRPERSFGERSLVMLRERSTSMLALAGIPRSFALVAAAVVVMVALVFGVTSRQVADAAIFAESAALQVADVDDAGPLWRSTSIIPGAEVQPAAPVLALAEPVPASKPARRRLGATRGIAPSISMAENDVVTPEERRVQDASLPTLDLMDPHGHDEAIDADPGELLPMTGRIERPSTGLFLPLLEEVSAG